MARSNARHLGLLNRWQEIIYEDPWRFNQISGQGVRLPQTQGAQLYIQYERDYIARALADAARLAANYLGYWPAPAWIEEEIVTVNCDLSWNRQTLVTRWGHLREFGRRATTLIEPAVIVQYSDSDDDQIDDLATITVTTDVAAEEIQVFHRVVDGAAAAASEFWQIEPLTVTKVGNQATITGPRWLFVHPKKIWAKDYETAAQIEKAHGDTGDAADFVNQVDVYRVYPDATAAVQLLLDPGVVGAENAVVNATATITNAEQGHFKLYTATGQTAPVTQPNTVRLWYRSGLPLVDGRMDTQLESGVVRYANTLMAQQPTLSERSLRFWTEDRKEPDSSAHDAWYPPPFGKSIGGTALWVIVKARRNELKGKPYIQRAG